LRYGIRIAQWFFIALAASGAASPLPDIGLPIEGLTAARLRDTFNEIHSGHPHEAIDIPAPRGTPVHAVASGTIRKLFLSKPGGNTIYEFDDKGEYCYYYAHLDRYAEGLREGIKVERGDVIGFVGSTGNADPGAPHLHFTIFDPGPEKLWWKGKALNPYPGLLAAVKRAP
jgi:murein DD-endopeptidase MepM/ murein hydrolase activator NlpD